MPRFMKAGGANLNYRDHTSKINDLCSSLNSKEMLQNLLYIQRLVIDQKKSNALALAIVSLKCNALVIMH